MAELQQIQINEETAGEGNISLEEQSAMQDKAAEQREEALKADPMEVATAAEEQVDTEDTTEEVKEERPEWLDEKFESAEEMAKAYSELQKKMSQPKEEETEAKEDEAKAEDVTPVEATTGAIDAARGEFSEKGELSDDTFKALEEAGLPREFVEQYIAGQEAMSVQQASSIQESIGGSKSYEAMSEWAGENLSDSELDAYNDIVEGGSIEQATVAVKGLYAQFQAAEGKSPALVQGSTSADSGVEPFGSTAQVTEAMRDPRYSSDPAFRAKVEQRMAVSSIF